MTLKGTIIMSSRDYQAAGDPDDNLMLPVLPGNRMEVVRRSDNRVIAAISETPAGQLHAEYRPEELTEAAARFAVAFSFIPPRIEFTGASGRRLLAVTETQDGRLNAECKPGNLTLAGVLFVAALRAYRPASPGAGDHQDHAPEHAEGM